MSQVIKQKDDELTFGNLKTEELHENLQKAIEARDAWQSIATEKMEMVADLQATLETLTTPGPCLSSTLPQPVQFEAGESSRAMPFLRCKRCHFLRACMVFLPCRHLTVCQLCDFTVSACPTCDVGKIESIEIVFGNE
jgi:E3 ubiquitin-protein ligase BOI and related proteins